MRQFMVTVKLLRQPGHDPLEKVTGLCPITDSAAMCTDTTGQHHTVLVEGDSITHVMADWKMRRGHHVTRIEEV